MDGFKPKGDYANTPNLLDQWILSRLNSLIDHTNKEMAAYRLYSVVPELLNFIESLTNTYIRFNRPHFWKDGMPEDKRYAYETLYYVLTTLSKVMAPFVAGSVIEKDLPRMAEQAYARFTHTAVAPLKQLSALLGFSSKLITFFMASNFEESKS